MKIEQLKYKENDSGWTLSPIEFFPDLTLLVGISGVGKTRILNAISNLKRIARGAALWGVEWDVNFSSDNNQYTWQGAFEARKRSRAQEIPDFALGTDNEPIDEEEQEEERKPRITHEQLTENSIVIFERNEQRVLFRGVETPKLWPFHSVLSILREEQGISPAHGGFSRILSVRSTERQYSRTLFDPGFQDNCKIFPTLESIRAARFPSLHKLALVHQNVPSVFRQISVAFSEVFPQVENLAIVCEKLRNRNVEVPVLKIKERGSDNWIPVEMISSGMYRTLLHLSQMKLWPDGTVILIDDFENSLGFNCINFITQDLIENSNRLQFILTSHHPYIINNIGTRHWKLVTRKGSVVTTHNASEFGLEKSSHEAFIKLINLEQYQEGIAVP